MKLTKSNVTRVLQKAGFPKLVSDNSAIPGFCYLDWREGMVVSWSPFPCKGNAEMRRKHGASVAAMRPILERYWVIRDADQGIGLEVVGPKEN